ncbi:protein of unknown function [Methylococcus capsulatus]|uniref:Uncharacterized protein n=1 Tax=Methylococcus capsulatus TaxID=414 RepID=A0AA35UFZ7_METCP|nr:protein of unknown function [Methylococcus capsulatus]
MSPSLFAAPGLLRPQVDGSRRSADGENAGHVPGQPHDWPAALRNGRAAGSGGGGVPRRTAGESGAPYRIQACGAADPECCETPLRGCRCRTAAGSGKIGVGGRRGISDGVERKTGFGWERNASYGGRFGVRRIRERRVRGGLQGIGNGGRGRGCFGPAAPRPVFP